MAAGILAPVATSVAMPTTLVLPLLMVLVVLLAVLLLPRTLLRRCSCSARLHARLTGQQLRHMVHNRHVHRACTSTTPTATRTAAAAAATLV